MTGSAKLAASLTAVLMLSAPAAFPVTPTKLSGSIAGYVRNSSGVPQMGATVMLFNRSERMIQQALTNERGVFGFASLSPDLYSIRVSLASFMPAVKRSITVQPGMQSLLYVDLASVLSSIELVYAAPGQGALMSDDWRWTLKGSAPTRPVLRMLPDFSASDPNRRDSVPGSIFSDTRGLVNVSAGDPGSLGGTYSRADLGTAFALATSVFGRNQLQVSGNVDYSNHAGTPGAGFRTSYHREGFSPEVSLTMQQIYLPARASLATLSGQPDGSPALRTMSLSVHDSLALDDNLRLDYGAAMDSVNFLDHLNTLSKFARLTYSLGSMGDVLVAFSSGAPPAELVVESHNSNHVRGDAAALAEDLAALSLLPPLSLLDGRLQVQRSQNLEVGYQKKLRATTVSLSAYRETVSNAAMTVVASDDAFAIGDVLPDISSKSSVLDAGSYQRTGFAASVKHSFGDRVEIGSSFGRGGALALADRETGLAAADDLRSRLQTTQRFWASARASATLPVTGTQISGSYQWTDYSVLMPDHFYLTQSGMPEAGLNVRLRQPIPSLPGVPGRLEATAELRNGLAQGYLPTSHVDQRVLLIQTPRALRGGLSFIF
ncbi:MAG: carboxypeptidase-like regulatory domain-containing protein [Acidobacteriia bacterium]|nr:carboxypeptidase-like regulatory domain-containing protein [Terriglobia bacterium]